MSGPIDMSDKTRGALSAEVVMQPKWEDIQEALQHVEAERDEALALVDRLAYALAIVSPRRYRLTICEYERDRLAEALADFAPVVQSLRRD